MARQTSIDCYNKIKESKLLPKRRLQAMEYLMDIVPCTASELQKAMPYHDGGRDCMKRISELAECGVVYERGVRPCRETGNTVIEWDLTDNLPKNIKPETNTKKERINKAVGAFWDLYNDNKSTEKWREVADLIKKI